MSSIPERADAIKKAMAEAEKAIDQRKRESADFLLKAIAQQFPEVESFAIRMYTPSFNDGDPCYNSMAEVIVNGLTWWHYEPSFGCSVPDEYDGEEDDDALHHLAEAFSEKRAKCAAMAAVSDLLNTAEDFFHTVYGTNVRVDFARDGEDFSASVSEYECGY